MSSESTSSNRRGFLSGRALRQQAERAGDALADALVDAGEHRPIPAGHDTIRLETTAMACQWAVVMNPGVARQVMTASDALDIVHQLEDQLTVYRDDSELMRINRNAGDAPQPVESGLFQLLLQCRRWRDETDGAFDPTSGPLIQLWRDCRTAGRIPTPVEIRQVLERVGIERVEFDEQAQSVRFPRSGFAFDLGAVGKGYAIDQAAAHLRREGLEDFLVHGGHSSLYAAGDHAGHDGWPVGIRNPLFTEERYATLLLKDRGMSTSGSNIQYFRHSGRRYGHILDPRTGWPAHSPDLEQGSGHAPRDVPPLSGRSRSRKTSDGPGEPNSCESGYKQRAASEREGDSAGPDDALLSVTVLAKSAAAADALSTAFYVMGLEKAREYCHNHPQVSAILIPAPTGGRTLSPVICNLPEEQLFFEPSAVRRPASDAARSPGPQRTRDN
jgi:FAD:protein FMN transferase